MRQGCGIRRRGRPQRLRGPRAALALLGLAVAVPYLHACSSTSSPSSGRAAWKWVDSSADEVKRLRAELERAELALRQSNRANAVSAVAAGRVQLERAAREAPSREDEIELAWRKLAEADRQLRAGQFGAAIFFVHRAESIAASLLREPRSARGSAGAVLVRGARVNVRAAPSSRAEILAVLTRGTAVFPQREKGDWVKVRMKSGAEGWIHAALLEAARPGARPASPAPWSRTGS